MDFEDGRGCSRWSWPSLALEARLTGDPWSAVLRSSEAPTSELSNAPETAFWDTCFPFCSSGRGFTGSFIPRGWDFLISRSLSFFITLEQGRSSRDHTPMLNNILKLTLLFLLLQEIHKIKNETTQSQMYLLISRDHNKAICVSQTGRITLSSSWMGWIRSWSAMESIYWCNKRGCTR